MPNKVCERLKLHYTRLVSKLIFPLPARSEFIIKTIWKLLLTPRRPRRIHLRVPLKFKPGYYRDPRMRGNNIMGRTKNGVLDEHGLRRENFYFSLQPTVSRTTGGGFFLFYVGVYRLARNHSLRYFIRIFDNLILPVFFSSLFFFFFNAIHGESLACLRR